MPNTTIVLKKSAVTSNVPISLSNGELAINFADGVLFYKHANGSIASFGGTVSFGTVNAAGTLLIADQINDVLDIRAGQNIIITGDAINDRMTINADLTAANTWANTKLSNTSDVSFAGNLFFPSGNVGIGTSNANNKLEVIGSSYLNGNVTTGLLKHSPVQIAEILTGFDTASIDNFGSVALSSDASVLAVGAYQWEGATGSNRGGVYIYDWNGSAWVQRGSVLEASDAANTDNFGISVTLSSNASVLAVGATNWEGATGSNRGGVYIYDWNGSAWVQRGSVLEASDAADTDQFGRSVALSSNASVLAVGSGLWEGSTGTDRGGVYIYDRSGSTWVQRGSVLEASDAANTDNFGISVTLSSNASVLAVGAANWEGATGTDRGGVYIYDWNGSAWVQRGSVLEASDAANTDNFCIAALSSDASVLAVGAYFWEGATGSNRGGVYIYDWNGSAWVQRGSVLEASDAADSDGLGRSVALSSDGSILTVGAYFWRRPSAGFAQGSVYTYSLTGALPGYSSVLTGSGWVEGSNSSLIARTAGLDRVTIDSNGNVGIGTSTPTSNLNVIGTANITGNLIIRSIVANGSSGTSEQVLASNGSSTYWANNIATIGYTIDGGGADIDVGVAGVGVRPSFNCNVNSVSIISGETGNIVIDIWKTTFAGFPPVAANSIVASAKPTLNNARTYEDSTLTGWTRTIDAGDVLFFNVDSCSNIKSCLITLNVNKRR